MNEEYKNILYLKDNTLIQLTMCEKVHLKTWSLACMKLNVLSGVS